MKAQYFYLIHIQYLGYRFHGWAKQPTVKTVHHMIDRTLNFLFEDQWFKTLGASRTDAMVSANHGVFELFLDRPLENIEKFVIEFNTNLPQDIRVLQIDKTDQEFNIIQASKIKEYHYLFSFGQKPHPFSAPFMASFNHNLDIELMQLGALLFTGTHEFKAYVKKPKESTITLRTIKKSEIVPNTFLTADFFPKSSFCFCVQGQGFMRNQIRLMMGQLLLLGQHQIDLKYIELSLKPEFKDHLSYVAPASGLILNRIDFSNA